MIRIPGVGLYRNALGEVAPASHLNFVIANGSWSCPSMARRRRIPRVEALQAVFPDRKVVGVPSRGLLGAGKQAAGRSTASREKNRSRWRKRIDHRRGLQASFGHDMRGNIAKTEGLVREAAKQGAQVILPPELFQGIYFPDAAGPEMVRDRIPRDASTLACSRWLSSRRR